MAPRRRLLNELVLRDQLPSRTCACLSAPADGKACTAWRRRVPTKPHADGHTSPCPSVGIRAHGAITDNGAACVAASCARDGGLRFRRDGSGSADAGRGPGAVALDTAFEVVAVYLPAVLGAGGRERDLVSAHAPIDGDGLVPGLERAGKHLEVLLELELALRELPRAVDFCRHDPQVGDAVRAAAFFLVRVDGSVRRP